MARLTPPSSPAPLASPLPLPSPLAGGVPEAIDAAKVLLELKTNRKHGPADFRRDAGALAEKIEDIQDEDIYAECKRLMKQMNKVFVAKTHSSWRPFVLAILVCLGIPKAKLEEMLGAKDRATWDIFLESTLHDADSLRKLIMSKVKRISPQVSKEERQKRQQAEMLAAAAEERKQLALMEMSPIKTVRAHEPCPELTEEERRAKEAAKAAAAERSKAFNQSHLRQHLQCIAAKKGEPILEVIAELEELGNLILEEASDTGKASAAQKPRKSAASDRNLPTAPAGRPGCLKRKGSKRPWSDTQSCMSPSGSS
eukprot:TRINITY_DN23473_c0_g2_i1.p1 TRINITY_DN23473_c0_g2~~TRINITY_DN23473_c0_g2_i1.p1  ORF type:complete len:312 (+),score=75.97 TRINITY_DN23473_c0_g2_i1:60-995(+)